MPNDSRHRGVVLLVLVASISCAPQRASVRPAYVPRPGFPDINRERIPLNDAATAEGIPQLRTVTLPPGVRELRISDWYSMIRGAAVPVLRVVEDHGVASGELIFVWMERPDWRKRYQHATRCADRADSTSVCVYVVPQSSSLDWRKVAARLDSIGAWTLHERCEDDMSISDAGDLIIERLDAGNFEQYRCNAPRYRRAVPAGARAALIYEYFLGLAKVAAP